MDSVNPSSDLVSRRCQMGLVEGAWPMGIHRLARQIAQQMREAYSDTWHTKDDLVELALLILGLQLGRAGTASELRTSIGEESLRLLIAEWAISFSSGSPRIIPCSPISMRRRIGRQLVERVDMTAVTTWAADRRMRALAVPVLDEHLLNRHRAHAMIAARPVRQTAARALADRTRSPSLPG